MARASADRYDDTGRLIAGYDYINQAWVRDGRYVRCGHAPSRNCDCYGRLHAGEPSKCYPPQHPPLNGHHRDCQDQILPQYNLMCSPRCPMSGIDTDELVPAGEILTVLYCIEYKDGTDQYTMERWVYITAILKGCARVTREDTYENGAQRFTLLYENRAVRHA